MEDRIKAKKAYAAPAIVIETVIADTIMCSNDGHGNNEGCCDDNDWNRISHGHGGMRSHPVERWGHKKR